MSYTRGLVFAAAIAVTTGAFVQPSAAASCPERMAALDRAVAARSLADVKRLETAIFQARMECIDDRPAAREKRAALEVALATEPDGSLRTDAEREAALVDAATRSDSWRASKALADFQAEHRRFVEAAATYDASIERALQFDHPSDAQRKELMRLAGAAKLLASDDRGGTANVPLKLSSRASNGLTGGIFSPALRGATAVAVPLPIQFATASSELTPGGQQAANELVTALKEQGVIHATLVGHTDTRGPADYNMSLSARRLQTVSAYLKRHGIGFDVTLVPKGLSEPFEVATLPYRPTQEETWALDRRVEWMRPPAGQ